MATRPAGPWGATARVHREQRLRRLRRPHVRQLPPVPRGADPAPRGDHGSAEQTRDGLFFLCFAGLAPAVLFLALAKLSRLGRSRHSEAENIALSLLFAFGTVYWFSSVQGTVWYVAHVVGAGLMAIYLYCSIGAAHPVGAGLALGFGFATRTSMGFAFPLFIYEAYLATVGHGTAEEATSWPRLD